MKPIIFSTPMVRAILDGRKTQTRRVIRPQPRVPFGTSVGAHPLEDGGFGFFDEERDYKAQAEPGTTLWVRETWYSPPKPLNDCLGYVADGDYPHGQSYRERPSIHMPRSAARLFLRVTAVRVERLQEISESDLKAEGAMFHDGRGIGHTGWRYDDQSPVYHDAKTPYAQLWDSLNAKRGYSWESNPYVWVISFERVQ